MTYERLLLIGYSYQETALSPRCLMFLNGYAYFSCEVDDYCEHTHAEVEGVASSDLGTILGKPPSDWDVSPLWHYQQYVQQYVKRSLTYQSDALSAFQGIADSLESSVGIGCLVFAIPKSCFDWGIMWKARARPDDTDGSLGRLERREGFPSWSWVGWQGEVMTLPIDRDEYRQQWLLEGTWIQWHIFELDDRWRTVWDSKLKEGPPVKKLAIHNENENPDLEAAEVSSNVIDLEEDDDQSEETTSPPSYGLSTKDDPFGRSTAWDFLYPLQPSLSNHTVTATSPISPGTLYLRAPIITLSIDNTKAARSPPLTRNVRQLLDPTGRLCGFLEFHDHRGQHTPNRIAKFACISTRCRSDLWEWQEYGLIKPVFQAFGQAERHDALVAYLDAEEYGMNFDFLNVMFIEQTGRSMELMMDDEKRAVQVSKRAGMGFVLCEALGQLGDIPWQDVILT